jgi:hypothetical protein
MTVCSHSSRAVERAEYEAQRAERRYRAVDPGNRLVARGLEARWENSLRQLEAARAELTRREQERPRALAQRSEPQFGHSAAISKVSGLPRPRAIAIAKNCCAPCLKKLLSCSNGRNS